LACKQDPMVRDRDETETFDFQSETRSRPRPSHISTRPRRLETTSRDCLETETSRPRLHPWLLPFPVWGLVIGGRPRHCSPANDATYTHLTGSRWLFPAQPEVVICGKLRQLTHNTQLPIRH